MRFARDIFERQNEDGSFISHGEDEIPHIITDFELSPRAITAAPGWLTQLKDETMRARVEKR